MWKLAGRRQPEAVMLMDRERWGLICRAGVSLGWFFPRYTCTPGLEPGVSFRVGISSPQEWLCPQPMMSTMPALWRGVAYLFGGAGGHAAAGTLVELAGN